MSIYDLFKLLGGLAFFLYGMNVMSGGLEKVAGGRLERTLRKMTSNQFAGILLGAVITIAIQSSSAMTVMLVGLVNSGIMTVTQTLGVIFGSNIGTTLTAWILSLSGIESENFFVNLLKPSTFSPIVALIGIILIMFGSKTGKKRDVGSILIGFAVLMYGMQFMSDSVSALQDMPEFSNLLLAFSNPIIAVLIATAFTGIIQSSAATVGILLAFAITGKVTYGMAIPIILGSNIGTCVTALLSSIGVNREAKKVSFIHIMIKIVGTVICMVLIYGIDMFVHFEFLDNTVGMVEISLLHTAFNIFTTIIFMPFTKQIVGITDKVFNIFKSKKSHEIYEVLDERLMRSPSFAIAESRNVTIKMAHLAVENLLKAISLLKTYNPKLSAEITEREEIIDQYEDKLGAYLVKISSFSLSDDESKNVSELLHTIGDFERIGDHAVNVQHVATEMYEKKITFSDSAMADLHVVIDALTDILDITLNSFEHDDNMLAEKVEPLEQVIDELIASAKNRHIDRLTNGNCTIELGFILSDLLTNFSRVSDHCSNVAVAIIQIKDAAFDTHGYLNEIKSGKEPAFVEAFDGFKEKYHLPLQK